MNPYLRALRFAFSQQANAYGFTLVVWGTGALAVRELGVPDPGEVFAFTGGALAAAVLIVATAFGISTSFRAREPERRAYSAMHVPSVPSAIAAGWSLTLVLGGWAGYLMSGFTAVVVYEAILSLEIGLARIERRATSRRVQQAPGRRRDPERAWKAAPAGVRQVFERVVVAVDGTPESAEAARQVALLMPPGPPLQMLTVVTEAELAGGWGDRLVLSPGHWERRLEPALSALPGGRVVETRPLFHSGPPAATLIEELARMRATLVALGSHGHGRMHDVLLGGVAATVLHHAHCSVLVARLDEGRPRRFRSITVDFDGSQTAHTALAAAETIADRFAADLTVVVLGDTRPPTTANAVLVENTADPFAALHDTPCDLLVLGSSRLHGLRALLEAPERAEHITNASILLLR